jgi:hypothetical protein
MRRKARRRFGFIVGIATATASAIGCGARTELDGDFPIAPDGGDVSTNASDGFVPVDASVPDIGVVAVDSSSVFDSSIVDVVVAKDSGAIDSGIDQFVPTFACTATPTLLAASPGDTDQIALDDSYVYFRDVNGVNRFSKSGGAPTTIVSTTLIQWPDPYRFVLTSDSIWWPTWNLAAGTTTINTVPKSGGATSVVTSVFGTIDYAAPAGPDAAHFWTGNAGNPELYIAHEGSWSGEVTPSLPAYTFDVEVDATGTTYLGVNDAIETIDIFGNVSLLATIPGLPGNGIVSGLAFDADNIYFFAVQINGATPSTSVESIPKTGGTPTTLYTSTDDLGKILVDAGHLYVTSRFTGTIVRMNVDGTDQTAFYQDTDGSPFDLASDDHCIYWTATALKAGFKGGVYAMAK